MVSTDYAFHHIECVIAILRGDASAIDRMDISADGFWRSFTAILYAFPAMFFGWVISAREVDHPLGEAGVAKRVLFEASFELLLWVGFLALLIFAIRKVGMGHRIVHYAVARNWFFVPLAYLLALISGLGMLLPSADGLMFVILLGYVFTAVFFQIKVTMAALPMSSARATWLVLGELFAALFVSMAIYLVLPSAA